MTEERKGWSRRASLQWLLALPAGVAVLATSVQPAMAKAKKIAVKYQGEPKGDRNCAGCRHFLPPKTGGNMGACKLVEGEISPNGWCAVWAKAS